MYVIISLFFPRCRLINEKASPDLRSDTEGSVLETLEADVKRQVK